MVCLDLVLWVATLNWWNFPNWAQQHFEMSHIDKSVVKIWLKRERAFLDKAWPSLVFHWRLLWIVNWPCGWIQSVPFTPQVVHTTLQFWQFNSPSYCTRLSHENHHQIICLGSDLGGVRCGWTINYFPIKTKNALSPDRSWSLTNSWILISHYEMLNFPTMDQGRIYTVGGPCVHCTLSM